MQNTYHLAINQNLVSDTQWLITCGDPGRTDKIASHLDSPEMIGNNREYRTWIGTLQNTKVAVISHGIGGPGLSIMLDEAFKSMPVLKGVIRVGTCGGLSKEASAGKVAISEGAVNMEMECSLLFIMGRLFDIPTACVAGIIGERLDSSDIIVEQMYVAVERAIRLVIEYLRSTVML